MVNRVSMIAGQAVAARQDLFRGWYTRRRPDVPAGTRGVVVVRRGRLVHRYRVAFDNGETLDRVPSWALAKAA
jgi:hypothetical protein